VPEPLIVDLAASIAALRADGHAPPERHVPVVATAAATAWVMAPASVRGSSSTTSARIVAVAIAGWCVGWPVDDELLAEPTEAGQGGRGQHVSLAGE